MPISELSFYIQTGVIIFGAGGLAWQVRHLNQAVERLEASSVDLMRELAKLDRRVVRLEERVPRRHRHPDENNDL